MEHKLKLLKKNRILFKNKELFFILHLNVCRSNFKLTTSQKERVYISLLKNDRFKILRSLKGYSVVSAKRKGFYSKFQLTRFEIKKFMSNRLLTGLTSLYW